MSIGKGFKKYFLIIYFKIQNQTEVMWAVFISTSIVSPELISNLFEWFKRTNSMHDRRVSLGFIIHSSLNHLLLYIFCSIYEVAPKLETKPMPAYQVDKTV